MKCDRRPKVKERKSYKKSKKIKLFELNIVELEELAIILINNYDEGIIAHEVGKVILERIKS